MRIRVRQWGLVIAFIMATAAGTATDTAFAAPWAAPGDARLRSDIETLRAFGLISGPVTTWPIPWRQITKQLDRDPGRQLPAYVMQALARVRDKAPNESNFSGVNFGIKARGTNKAALVRSFDDTARDKVDTEVSAEKYWSSTAARITVGYQRGTGDSKIKLDGSYLAQALGNWTVYGGWINRWWGPGRESALLFSTNARPMPSVGLMRLDPKPFGTKWLSWLGPWQFNIFMSRQENDRDYAHPIVVGMRLSINPIKNLDISFSRALQLCGSGRPCRPKIWLHSFIGVGNLDNVPGPDEPGNQLAGYDISYGFFLPGDSFMSVYGEAEGEDEAYYLPSAYAVLLGATVTGPWGYNGSQWRITAEWSNTHERRQLFWGKKEADVIYNNHIYKDGFRYLDRALGHSLDSDSELITLDGEFTSTRGWVYNVKLHKARINFVGPGLKNNPLSGNAEKITIGELGLKMPSSVGQFEFQLRYQTDSPNTPDRKVSDAQAEVRWTWGF